MSPADRGAAGARAVGRVPVAAGAGSSSSTAPEDARERADREDTELMNRFKAGDARAFEALLARHRRGVFNFCLKMLGNRTAAEDALQEVFLRVVKSAKDWQRQAKLTTWIYTIARNHCVDAIRRAGYRKTASLDHAFNDQQEDATPLGDRVADQEGIPPDRGAESARTRRILAVALADLPAEQREVFVMREHAGMPFKEIAAVVGVPENTAKSRMRYALEHLRARLIEAGVTRDDP